MNKRSRLIAILFFAAILISCSRATKEKSPESLYVKDIVPIVTEVDLTTRNIQFNHLNMKEGAKNIASSIEKARSLKCPEGLDTLNKKIILSFKKMRMGFLLFSVETKTESVRLVKSGAGLLKEAALEIKEIAQKQGMVKKKGSF